MRITMLTPQSSTRLASPMHLSVASLHPVDVYLVRRLVGKLQAFVLEGGFAVHPEAVL